MADPIFTIGFIENFKILITGILIYAIIFAILQFTKPFGGANKINSLIALMAAIIVSFSGVVTYAITYAINWFVIIIFIVFLAMMLIMFLGVKPTDIAKGVGGKNTIYIVGIFLILFSVIIIKSFFAVNNTFDTNNPQNNSYDVNTDYNDGFSKENKVKGFWENLTNFNISQDLLYSVLFLIILGIFVMIIGK